MFQSWRSTRRNVLVSDLARHSRGVSSLGFEHQARDLRCVRSASRCAGVGTRGKLLAFRVEHSLILAAPPTRSPARYSLHVSLLHRFCSRQKMRCAPSIVSTPVSPLTRVQPVRAQVDVRMEPVFTVVRCCCASLVLSLRAQTSVSSARTLCISGRGPRL